jgi:hypothetical protein
MGKNDFGIHAVFKTRGYYMLKIKSGRNKANLPPGTSLKVQEYGHGIQRQNGFTKIHVMNTSDEAEIVSVMNYFQFIFGKP